MNRYDWILVGMCLYGIHLMVQGVLAALAFGTNPSIAQLDSFGLSDLRTSGILHALVTSFVGSCLVLASLKLGASMSKSARRTDRAALDVDAG
jgi:hypothetical protein